VPSGCATPTDAAHPAVESLWKLIWLNVVAAPLWAAGRMDQATWAVVGACALVVIVLAVIPGDSWSATT
jgi:hypothetical protein